MTTKPPTVEHLAQHLGASPDIIPSFDQWIDYSGRLVPAIALANGDWRDPIQPMNLMATACWHFFAKAKGINIQSHVTGPVIVFTGDQEFLELVGD